MTKKYLRKISSAKAVTMRTSTAEGVNMQTSTAEGVNMQTSTSKSEGADIKKLKSTSKSEGPDIKKQKMKAEESSSSSEDESKMTASQIVQKKLRAVIARTGAQTKSSCVPTQPASPQVHAAAQKISEHLQNINRSDIKSTDSEKGAIPAAEHHEFLIADSDDDVRDSVVIQHNDLKIPAAQEQIMAVSVMRDDPKGPRVLVHSNPGEWANLLSQTETLRDGTVKDMPSQLFDCMGFGVSHARQPTRNIAAEGSTSGDHGAASSSPVHLQHAAEDLSHAEAMRHIAGSSSGLQLIADFGCEGPGVDQLFGPPHGLQLLTTFHCTNDNTLPVLCKDRVEERSSCVDTNLASEGSEI